MNFKDMSIAPIPDGMRTPFDEPPDSNPAPNQMIATPTLRQSSIFSMQRQRTCGMCRHFRWKAGQQQMWREKFLNKLHDYGWRKKHLCDKPENMGLCGQHDDMLTGPNSLACEYFKVK